MMISIILLLILVILYFVVGNYFYNFALKREKIHKKEKDDMSKEERAEFEESKKWFEQNTKETEIYQENGNLRLCGYIAKQESNNWIIIVHGYKGKAKNMAVSTKKFFEYGFNTLTPDLRGHGKSEGNYVGMGWHDRLDIIKWINYILKQDKNANIVLYGVSMGGATVMMASGEELPTNVKCIIEDCGYSSIWEEFSHELKYKYKLPVFPILNAANTVCKIRAKYDIKEGSCVEKLKKCKIPILFIHGDKDDFVPFYMLEKVYEADKGEKEKLVVKGAEHAKAYAVAPEVYWNTIKNFIKKSKIL